MRQITQQELDNKKLIAYEKSRLDPDLKDISDKDLKYMANLFYDLEIKHGLLELTPNTTK